MKTRPLAGWTSTVTAGGTMPLLSVGLLAQPCTLWPDGCQFLTNHTCSVTTNWVRAVDLDGDETPDLWHRRLYVGRRCSELEQYLEQHDQIEAFHPEAHVEVWVKSWSQFTVQPGELIGDPVRLECVPPVWPCRAWCSEFPPAQPYLQAEGLGIIKRFTDLPDCLQGGCGWTMHGVLRPDDPSDWSPWPVLIGFRIERSGEWHVG